LFKRIVVGYDGSAQARKALEVAVDLARRYGAEVISVTVVDIGTASSDPNAVRIARDAAEQIASEASEKLSREGVAHRAVVRQGDPGDEIVRVASESSADLIIVGSRGLSTLRRLLLGSVSRKVLNKSKIPVLVVK